MKHPSRFRLTLAALAAALLLSTSSGAFASGGADDGGGGGNGGGGNGGGADKSLVLRVNPAIGAPGGTVAVVLRTYAPRPVRQGQIVVRVARRKPAKGLGLTLEDLTAPVRPLIFLSATVYSPRNDALTQGLLNGLADSQLAKVTFQSPSGSVNSADGPLAVFLFRLDPSVKPGDAFDLTLDPVQTGLTDAAGAPVTLAPRSDVLTVRAPSAPFKLEADGDKVQPGAVAELGVNTFEPFGVSGGRITLTWDARLSGGAPTVKLDPRYGKSTYTVDSSKPGRLVVDFKSPDSSFNTIPGTIVAISL
ncbi:MAG TPA: hypothetical protein VLR69_03310, partial [Thermoanaerobaculia bacterium]|nr:hypothetical protein [Thermoanaerobaculia bacterium]